MRGKKRMALTCDRLMDEDTRCGKPATTQLSSAVRDRVFGMDMCDECAGDYEAMELKFGVRVRRATVKYKVRAAYVTKSGRSFTAEDARPWLVEHGLAGARGRLSRDQLDAYAASH